MPQLLEENVHKQPLHLLGTACRQPRQQWLRTLWCSAHWQGVPPRHRHQAGHWAEGLEGWRTPWGARHRVQNRSERHVLLQGLGD